MTSRIEDGEYIVYLEQKIENLEKELVTTGQKLLENSFELSNLIANKEKTNITVYKNIDELVKDFVETNVFLSEDEIEHIKECNMVIEDILPSGSYTELEDGRIIKY